MIVCAVHGEKGLVVATKSFVDSFFEVFDDDKRSIWSPKPKIWLLQPKDRLPLPKQIIEYTFFNTCLLKPIALHESKFALPVRPALTTSMSSKIRLRKSRPTSGSNFDPERPLTLEAVRSPGEPAFS